MIFASLGSPDSVPHPLQSEKQDPDSHLSEKPDADPQH
jgi:hypothetical protein